MGINTVVVGDDLAYGLCDVGHGYARSRGDAYQADVVALTVHPLHEREWDDDALFGTSVDVHGAGIVIDAHHLIIDLVHANALSAGVAPTGKEVFIYFLADDTHLAVVTDVHVVDVAAIAHPRLLHMAVGREQPFEHHACLLVGVCGIDIPARRHGGDDIQLRDAPAQQSDVGRGHVPDAPLAKPCIGFGGGLCIDECRIGGEALEIVTQHVLHAMTSADEEHQHEDAPEHSEACEQAPALVARQGVDDFPESVGVYEHIACLLDFSCCTCGGLKRFVSPWPTGHRWA